MFQDSVVPCSFSFAFPSRKPHKAFSINGQKPRKEKETQESQSTGWVDSLAAMLPSTPGGAVMPQGPVVPNHFDDLCYPFYQYL